MRSPFTYFRNSSFPIIGFFTSFGLKRLIPQRRHSFAALLLEGWLWLDWSQMQSNTHRTVSSDPVSVREDTVNSPSFSQNVTVDFILVAAYFWHLFDEVCVSGSPFGRLMFTWFIFRSFIVFTKSCNIVVNNFHAYGDIVFKNILHASFANVSVLRGTSDRDTALQL